MQSLYKVTMLFLVKKMVIFLCFQRKKVFACTRLRGLTYEKMQKTLPHKFRKSFPTSAAVKNFEKELKRNGSVKDKDSLRSPPLTPDLV